MGARDPLAYGFFQKENVNYHQNGRISTYQLSVLDIFICCKEVHVFTYFLTLLTY